MYRARINSPTRMTVTLSLLLSTAVSSALATELPRVYFDVHHLIGCRDVTTNEFCETHPDERQMEATFHVSSLIKSGNEEDLVQYFYRIDSPGKDVQIVDYLPKTSMTTNVAGNVTIERKSEDTKSLGVTFSGAYDYLFKGTGTAGIGSKDNSAVRYELLPPMKLLASSGTVRRGSGVYFKLKPSKRETLEGGKEFVVVMRVSKAWRCELVHVRCRAVGCRRGVISSFDTKNNCGRRDFCVVLYAVGDLEAKMAAEQYVDAESELRRIAANSRDKIEKQSYPTVSDKLSYYFAAAEPKVPQDWVSQLIFAPPAKQIGPYQDRLPDKVRETALEYVAAKQKLSQLNSDRPGDSDARESKQ